MNEPHTFLIEGAYFSSTKKTIGNKCFPSLNDLINSAIRSQNEYNNLKKKFQRIAYNSIRRDLKGWKPKGRVRLHFEYGEPKDGHYRDYDNVAAGAKKIIIDALGSSKNQQWVTKTIIDDKPKYFDASVDRFVYTDGTPYIKVTIEEL